ncbi:MAG: DNA polymerase/3'-5' exonuclease PolX [Candidatus Marinimicrobia bacterium]|nr:DNA polymerase/3'-5' exonuclease PolX [Candidatus Neomarinimicrobiota bacterium]
MENATIAELFDEIADLLELRSDNPFRVRSYRSAAQSIRNLSDRLEDLEKEGRDLTAISQIGASTAEKIVEILETGTCKRVEDLRKKVPKGLPEVMRIPGVGPKKAMRIHDELDVNTIESLKRACEDHKLRGLEGFGEKTEKNILKGIATVQSTAGRMHYHEAADHLAALKTYLDGLSALNRWEVAGSFRRGQDTIGDLDILVCADDRQQATEAMLDYDAIHDVISRGPERLSVRLAGGPQVDFRFFEPSAFGAALVYFTGSKAHNIQVRRIAQDRDWKLNEYGLFSGDRRLAGKSEKAVYKRLDMKWVPPELREDRGEVEEARAGHLPRLIQAGDIRGDLQCHTTASDGKNSIEEMAEAARQSGYDFLAITDHSQRVTMAHGLNDERAARHADAIRQVDSGLPRFWLLAGIEVDILKSGRLDLKEQTLEQLDWVVASIHYDRGMSRKKMTARMIAAVSSGVVHCLGHPLGRIIGQRDPLDVDLDKVIEACIAHNVRLEINAQPDRLDLPDQQVQHAREAGAKFTLGTDAHSVDGFRFMPFGVKVARRGWLRKGDVLNTKSMTALRKELKK